MSAQPLAVQVGVVPACQALGVSRATFYRRRRSTPGHQQPRPTPARALCEAEREQVLDVLAGPRFVDRAIVDGICQIAPPPTDHGPIGFPIRLPWRHTTHFGDGLLSLRTELTYRDVVEGSHPYRAARTYTMRHFVSCLCESPFGFGHASNTFAVPNVNFCREPTVAVLAADVVRDQIVVSLEPTGITGTLEVALMGGSTHVITTRTASGGTHTLSFEISSVPIGTYTGVRATWSMPGYTASDTKTYWFSALGNYTHTIYNTPTEAGCTGSPDAAYISSVSHDAHGTPMCAFAPTTMKADFISQANLNGSGISLSHGTIEREKLCRPHSNFPVDGTNNTFRGFSSVRGHCDTRIGNDTVAVDFEVNSDLSCGDRIYIIGLGVKTVTDRCPDCGPTGIDNYTTIPACHQALGKSTRRTIKLSRITQ